MQLIIKCPVTANDAKSAFIIYGTTVHAVPIPATIFNIFWRSHYALIASFVHVQDFLSIISRNIQHHLVHPVLDRTKRTIIKHLDKSIRVPEVFSLPT
jgi:hypothetical protein